MKKLKTGFTLLELLVVIVIIGILVTSSLLNYQGASEKTKDREAQANLKILQASQKIYHSEIGHYYPEIGQVNNIATINQNLGVFLPADNNRNWDYEVHDDGDCQAVRKGGDGRAWCLPINDVDGEPNPGVC